MDRQIAFKMHLKEGMKEEYRRRHAAIWPEIVDLLKKQGVSDYSIFLDEETGTLFSVQRVNGDGGSQDLGGEEAMKRWWHYMAPLMDVNEDESPVSIPLEEMFHLD